MYRTNILMLVCLFLGIPLLYAQETRSEVPAEPRSDGLYTDARFRMAVKTNQLYDVFLVPNVGVEFYLGKDWSVSANGMLMWWSNTAKHHFWRIYGGELEVRRWFGSAAQAQPLTGHHTGIYGQLLSYDFGSKDKGYLAEPWNYAFGISYGYSFPITRRINIDLGIGIGYMGGEYKKYKPIDGCYVWQSTRRRHWVGPTKAEVTLVWLLGRGNTNQGKGSNR